MNGDPDTPNIGELFVQLEEKRNRLLDIGGKMTNPLEQRLAHATFDLAHCVSDVLYLLREHLACHDCTVVDHVHGDSGVTAVEAGNARVFEVYEKTVPIT